jgi:hypothetical protein
MKFQMSTATLGMGLAAGFVAAVFSIGHTLQYGSPIGRALLGGAAATGLVAVFNYVKWADDLQTRCERYEDALRRNGIDPT